MIISMSENTPLPLPSVREFVETSVDFRSRVMQEMPDAESIAFEALEKGIQASYIAQAIEILSDSIHVEIRLLIVGIKLKSQVILGSEKLYKDIAKILLKLTNHISPK
jgi:hypothetical protein